MKKEKIKYILLGLVLIIVDQITKILVKDLMIIKSFLKFTYIKNTGAAFGILSGNRIIIILVTLILIGYLIYDSLKNNKTKLELFSYLLIISGAIGNLIDRVFFGYVRDFISFTLFSKEMAIFNVADIYITFGVIIYLYIIIRDGSNERNNSRK